MMFFRKELGWDTGKGSSGLETQIDSVLEDPRKFGLGIITFWGFRVEGLGFRVL
jgi:hypothetical protein